MINIPCPTRNEVTDIESIIDEKNTGEKKTTLKRLLKKLKERYIEFAEIELNNRIPVTIFLEEEKEALKSLYSSQTATAKAVTDAIIKAQLARQAGCCLSCGIGEADQIDHFLPQKHFPEYSILHKNLAPICGTCNELKGENIPGQTKDFLHVMFDLLPIEVFITCEITYSSDDVPVAHFAVAPPFNGQRIQHHFDSLDLAKRLQEKATQYFLQIKAIKTEIGESFAQEEVERDQRKLAVLFSINFWKVILCAKMIETQFVQKITS
jgi:hypothetical protein